MSVRQTIVASSFLLLLCLISTVASDLAQAQTRWPPWQSYSEAEEQARQKALHRRGASARELAVLKRQIDQLRAAGKYAQAEPLAKRLLALSERRGAASLAVADALDTLAGLYEAQDKFADAEPLLARSVAIREKAPGQPGLSASRDRLAAVYDKLGKTAEASALRGASQQRQRAEANGEAAAQPKVEQPAEPPKTKETVSRVGDREPAPAAGQGEAEAPLSIPPADGPPGGAAPPVAADEAPPAEERSAGEPFSIPPSDGPAGGSGPPANGAAEPRRAEKRLTPPAAKPALPKFGMRSMMPRTGSPPVGGAAPSAPSAPDEAARAAPPQPSPSAPSPGVVAEPAPPPPPVAAAPSETLEGGSGAPASSPEMQPRSADDAPAAASPPAGERVTVAPSGAALAPAASPDWQVVPVYWGTDRAVQPNAQRLAFGSDRARKLQLGVAQITVPKVHEVPNVERPWVVKIPYFDVTLYAETEDPKRHFTVKDIKALTKEELLAQVRERLKTSSIFKDQALVFVHGYNTSFDNALYRTAQIAYDLDFDGAPFLYSWPSGGAVASYTYDRESAQAAEPYLRQFLDMVTRETGAKKVSIIAHSMGNQPLMDVLRDMKSAAPEGVTISQVILAAPDVDADSFTNLANSIKGLAENMTLYVAANDRALIVSRNFWGNYRAGDVPPAGPLVLPGIDTIDVTAASTDVFAINHSGYAANNLLLEDIGELLKTGLRPPEMRTLKPGKISTTSGEYWRYVAPPQ